MITAHCLEVGKLIYASLSTLLIVSQDTKY